MKKEPKMTKAAPMYVHATEMVSHYYKRLGLSGKRVLTTIGSGDQVINAFFYGADEVVGFDINRNASFLTELKIAAIKALTYREFMRFFSQTKSGFNETLYKKVRPMLSKACGNYFDSLYEEVGSSGLGASVYFRKRNHLISRAKSLELNAYLTDASAYEKTRQILMQKRPVLLVENVLTLGESKKLQGKEFDIINLSNIPNYLTGRSFGLAEEDVISFFQKLQKLCSRQGFIFFYSYSNSLYPNEVSSGVPPISSPAFLQKLKQSGAFFVSQKSFAGIKDETKDRITILAHRA